ncbi:hypothetical protein LUZ61_019147 [Rhynchospora tenuis]|uniref:Kinesin-like protein n=1 Tax=Rhynchospora tenuis TaxID=198213 RepID=A0AAD5ZAM1_9POAL|nr:hypothetical protein LUZ61_019147 [Rhynchospora tenuis]
MASAGGGPRGSVRPERHVQTGRGGNSGSSSTRTKSAPPKRPSSSGAKSSTDSDNAADAVRVRVAVRLRPKNNEDFIEDGDFTSCVELQPEAKKLRLKKNNWSSELYKFDEVFTEGASQRRVYEAVAKPVVESVLEGYNGTVMAYGQTGTGKTYTMARLGKDDPSERGIMVRALEDILASISSLTDSVAISYLQLYLESVQDLLAPDKTNIPIVEDPKSGDVSLPGAAVVELRDIDHFNELLHFGEANRYAANTKLNTESSRSHAILVVHVQRSVKVKDENEGASVVSSTDDLLAASNRVPIVLKSKLLIVDLAGSERIDKSGSVEGPMLEEAKFINLSLTSLGKCINALAENCPYIPTRDSKLTRLLRDSFGGTARTSLIITIGPSARYYSETSSTILFGQRAMKIVNTVKLKEEVDYESLYKKLECQVDSLTSELERIQKIRQDEKAKIERKLRKQEESLAETKRTFTTKCENLEKENDCMTMEIKKLMEELNDERDQNNLLSGRIVEMEMLLSQNKQQQLENSTYKKALSDSTQMYEDRIKELLEQVEKEQARCAYLELEMRGARQEVANNENSSKMQENSKVNELQKELRKLKEESRNEIQHLEAKNSELLSEKDLIYEELKSMQEKVMQEARQRRSLEDEIVKLKKALSESNAEQLERGTSMLRTTSGVGGGAIYLPRTGKSRDMIPNQKDTISKIFEEVGLSNILALLKSEDLDVQIHAVKVVANLAAEDINQEKIVEEGGLDALLSLLETSENTTIHRVTAGALANLAMNGSNQGLIMNKGGAGLLANVANKNDDPQTLRMVAGAIANLCGNEKLHVKLKEDGGIKALVGMVRSGHVDVIAQIARGIANFAKCESRAISQGHRKGRSLLIDDGALKWMVTSPTTFSASTRRHIELAFCHLSQNEENTRDIITSGGIKELVRISQESTRDDIRILAKKALNSNPAFLREIQ